MVEIDGVGAEEVYVPWLGQPFGTPYPDPPPEPPTRNRFGVLSILRHEGQAAEYEEVSIAQGTAAFWQVGQASHSHAWGSLNRRSDEVRCKERERDCHVFLSNVSAKPLDL
jgi:hypothetical protein